MPRPPRTLLLGASLTALIAERAYLGLSASYALNDRTELEFMVSRHDDAPISPTGVPNGFVGLYDLDQPETI